MPLATDRIREIASEKYVRPALKRGESHIVIRVKELQAELYRDGFPTGRTPMVCSALRGKKFLNENNLEIEKIEGPPSRQSTTVVYHYRHTGGVHAPLAVAERDGIEESSTETSVEWARRLAGKMRGLLREELAAYGGGEAFIKWVRSDDKDAA